MIKKRLVFSMTMLAIPLVIIALLELTLFLFDAFPQAPLFTEDPASPRTMLRLNPGVASRYLDTRSVAIPTLAAEPLDRRKSPAVRRIICLGGSTTAGFPFDGHIPFPQQLRALLAEQLPGQRFEILNGGLSAMNSFTVLDLLPEVLAQSPDAVIIYMGHNEFYGIYGSGSAFSVGSNGPWIRFYLKLQKFRTVQMIRAAVNRLLPAPQRPSGETTLMEQVIGDRAIALDSPKYRQTLRIFGDNLRLILAMCAERQVPVLLSNLVSNVRSMPPFASAPVDSSGSYGALVARGDSLVYAHRFDDAAVAYGQAMALDSSAARLHYMLGRSLQTAGEPQKASRFLFAAKDHDILRFRASEDINDIIRQEAGRSGATFVDMLGHFRSLSLEGIPGRELFCDHLHPNPRGYFQMARAFADGLRSAGLLPADAQAPPIPPDGYWISDLDWDIGLLKIHRLMQRWPFQKRPSADSPPYSPHGIPEAAELARAYVFEHHDWVRSKNEMARLFVKNGHMEAARNEYMAVQLMLPRAAAPWMGMGTTFQREERWADAERCYLAAIAREPRNGLGQYHLAITQWKQRKLDLAIANMRSAAAASNLSSLQRSNARFFLARFLLSAGQLPAAREILETLLREMPDFQPAHDLLGQIPQ